MGDLVYSLFDYFDKMPFIVSFVAGLLSFFSPCVLPLVPIYFFYITGISINELEKRKLDKKERVKIFLNSLLFVLGFALVFILIGAAAANLIGNIFSNRWLNIVAGIVIVIFGLNIGGFVKFKIFQYEKRLHLENVGSFLLGVSFALGWTPCIGPIFGTIVGMAATEPAKSVAMMVIYALGLAIPFLLMAIFTLWSIKFIQKARNYMHLIEKFSGILLILVGIYFIFKGF